MNKWTLKFESQQLEDSFHQYYSQKCGSKIVLLTLVTAVLAIICSIAELFQTRYAIAAVLASIGVIMAITYLIVRKNLQLIPYLLPMYSVVAIFGPELVYFLMIQSDSINKSEKLAEIMICYVGVGYLQQVEQIYILHVVQHLNLNVLAILMIIELQGFTYLLCVLGLYTLVWLKFDYQNVYDQRKLFQESQINKSILNIVDTVVTDNLAVYKYNDQFVKFDCEIQNQSLLQFLNDEISTTIDSFKTLLTDIYVHNQLKIITLSSFLYQCKCSVNSNCVQFELQGYYKQRDNKLRIVVDIQTIEEVKYIVRIIKVDRIKSNYKSQLQFLKSYEYITSQTMSKLSKLDLTRVSQSCLRKCKHLLDDYHLQIQVLSLKYSNTMQKDIRKWNICNSIETIMQNKQIRYILNTQEMVIQTDYQLINLLFRLLAHYQSNNIADQLIIKLTDLEDKVMVQVHGISLTKTKQKLKYMLLIIIQHIGSKHSIIISDHSISFAIYSNLYQSWAIDQFNCLY